jgi:hypothetical protein
MIVVAAACGGQPEDETGLVEDLGTLMPGEPETPSSAEVAPDNVRVLFADDLVHVSEITLQPGESVPNLETHHRLYFHSAGAGELDIGTSDDAAPMELDIGDVRSVGPGEITITNTGQQPVILIEVARTESMLPEYLDTEVDTSAGAQKVLLVNDNARVLELTLKPGQRTELARVPIRVIYSPLASQLEYETADGDLVAVPSELATAYARSGSDLSISNAGDVSVTVIAFEWFI